MMIAVFIKNKRTKQNAVVLLPSVAEAEDYIKEMKEAALAEGESKSMTYEIVQRVYEPLMNKV